MVLGLLLGGCASREPVLQEPSPVIDGHELRRHLERGEDFFEASHLWSWRRAEAEFEAALDLHDDSDNRERLLLTQYLVLNREIDEEIYASRHGERLHSICSRAITPFQTMLCGMARGKLRAAGLNDDPPPGGGVEFRMNSRLLEENPELAGYLRFYYLKDHQPWAYTDGARSVYADTYLDQLPEASRGPLTLYLKLRARLLAEDEFFLEKYPRFAELFAARGRWLFEAERFQEGVAALERAVELIPDHTGALNRLGNMYLFSLEHHQRALEHFDRTLSWDPASVEALFGKAAALHYLGRHTESQRVLDQLLDDDATRWGTVPQESRRYYRGNGYYYRAFNFQVMENPEAARRWVDLSLRYTPEYDGPHYLSGVLRFDEGDLASAQADFHRVIEDGTQLCDAYYRLGQIALSEGGLGTLPFFMSAGICLERNLDELAVRLERIPSLAVDDTTKTELTASVNQWLRRERDNALATIQGMRSISQSLGGPGEGAFNELMEKLTARLTGAEWEQTRGRGSETKRDRR